MKLPLYLDEIGPDWLTYALQRDFPGVAIAAAYRHGGHRGTSMSARFDLVCVDRADRDGLPDAVYVKGGFDDKWRKRVYQALQQEAEFYNGVAADVKLNIPRCYFAEISDAPQGIVVLENLPSRGARFATNLAPVTVDQVAAVLTNIAKMHADWWQDSRLLRYIAWREQQRTFLRYCYRPKHWEELLECRHGDMLEHALGSSEMALRSLDTLWNRMDNSPATFLHGDLHGGNIFYEADGRPGFLDWQLCFSGNYAHDMSWVIVTAFDVDQRRSHERTMVQHYLDELQSHGGEAIDFDHAWLSYRQNMAHAIASYGAVPRDMGAPDLVERSAERVLHAALDHDVLRALDLR